eukprot:11222845-Alexandrium_andersonii.AAC.1
MCIRDSVCDCEHACVPVLARAGTPCGPARSCACMLSCFRAFVRACVHPCPCASVDVRMSACS